MLLQLPTEVLVLYQELSDDRAQAAILLHQLLPVGSRVYRLNKVSTHGPEGGLLALRVRYHGGFLTLPCVYQ
jgi:hypothetical protein